MSLEELQKRYTTFEKELFFSDSFDKEIIGLQKRLVVAAGWGLIYQKNSNPEYGFFRASKLLQDFNRMFGWNLSPNIYKKVLEKDYSLENPEIMLLLNKKKKQKRERKEEENLKKRNSIFSKFVRKKRRNLSLK